MIYQKDGLRLDKGKEKHYESKSIGKAVVRKLPHSKEAECD
jgi:hypothetical protein